MILSSNQITRKNEIAHSISGQRIGLISIIDGPEHGQKYENCDDGQVGGFLHGNTLWLR